MFQFIESICCINRDLRNIELHQDRFEKTRKEHFPEASFIRLLDAIQFPNDLNDEKYKVRIVYGAEIESIEFIPYVIKEIKTIKLFAIDNEITYFYKYTDRSFLDEYIKKTQCDDLVLVKDNFITDATYSNLIFFNGVEWHTPITCMLNGTMRQQLLKVGRIKEVNIKVNDLCNYFSFKRINAMMNFEEAQDFDIQELI